MDYLFLIQKSIDYIDENIKEDINPEILANISGFSKYHFYKIFNIYIGMPVMEYVVKRKLQYALYDISKGQKIIDIAMDYGFETHAGFTKAFKKTFNYPPSIYRLHAPTGIPPKIDLFKLREIKTGGIVMQPKIIEKDSFKIAGYGFKTTMKNSKHTRDIPVFWNECGIEGCEAKLYKLLNPPKHGEYGICVNVDMETDEYFYVFGVEVLNFNNIPEDMYRLEVPAATYAVFTTPPVEDNDFVSSIQGTWKYILEEWFPNSDYKIDDTNLDFEFYDERCHPWEYDKVVMDIYVPIIKNRL
ncbi:AraC family transcriptional regulator [Tissierella sp. MSJ-40]|uniref:AraC family transcriptional regulator n=1 Tax=Tissierella simiarum TaxID=2841534 RepID=A0ABS6E703_9FIRM|nr:AraC family transcriptional regulator [Tissierella simiarum]MBU5438695.1 AraC family transcriptional regulator [Tissierella simiarum]